jgi:uncharacterized protein (DUF58 family)
MVIDEATLSEIEALGSVLKNNIAGMFGGNHQAKSFGSSCEFADYRDYRAGDDVNKIDWKLYARFDKLYQKLYLDERQMHTRIYIDTSRSIEYQSPEKAEQVLKLAAALSYLSVVEMDKVSVYAVSGSELTEVLSGVVGKDNFLSSIGKLNEIEFSGEAKLSEAIVPSNVGMGDGYSILISDFLSDEDFFGAIDKFAEKRRDILAIQVLSREELNPQFRGKMHLFDAEVPGLFFRKKIDKDRINAYKEALSFVRDRIKNYSEARCGSYLLVPAHAKLFDVFFGDLVDTGVLK